MTDGLFRWILRRIMGGPNSAIWMSLPPEEILLIDSQLQGEELERGNGELCCFRVVSVEHLLEIGHCRGEPVPFASRTCCGCQPLSGEAMAHCE